MWITAAALAISLAIAAPNAEATEPRIPFGGVHNCFAILDSPHPSGRVIKGHMRIKCSTPVAGARVQNQLWRLRAWGWEPVGKAGKYEKRSPGKFFDTSATWRPDGGCYHYMNSGYGWILLADGTRIYTPGPGRNYDVRYLNEEKPGCGLKW